MVILPDDFASGSVDRLNHVSWIAEIHNAVVNDRCDLVRPRRHCARPDELQVFDIGLVDLLERAVTPALIIASKQEPVFGLWRAQHGVRDGYEIRHRLLRWCRGRRWWRGRGGRRLRKGGR